MGCHFLLQCMKVKSESEAAQSCPTLSDPMDCSLPGSSVHGIFQARVLEWGAILCNLNFPGDVSAGDVRDEGLIPGSGRFPEEGNGKPLQYSCLGNPMDGGTWWAAVHGVAKSRTRLSVFTFTFHSCIRQGNGNPLQCSCLENPRDRGAWWAAIYGVTQSRTRLK